MAFEGWTRLGGQIVGPPCIRVWSSQFGDIWWVIARGTDDLLWSHGSKGGWYLTDEAMSLASGPVVDNHVRFPAHPQDLAVATSSGETWVKMSADDDWRLIGGRAVGEPALVARQFVLVRGTDDRLWARRWGGDWAQVDGHWRLTSPPTVAVQDVQDSDGWHWIMRVAAAAVAPGHDRDGIWEKTFDSSTEVWQEGWFDRGGRCQGAPSILAVHGSLAVDGSVPIFVRGLDDFLWTDWTGEWRCVNADLKLTSSPGVTYGWSNVHIAVRGPDGAAYYACWDGL